MPDRLKIEFAEPLRGKNALHFWAGVGILVLAVYAWINGYFSGSLFAADVLEPPESGYGVGLTTLAIDTVCLVGLAGVTVAKLCWKYLLALGERLSHVAGGVYAWAAEARGHAPRSAASPDDNGKIVDALRSLERRVREHDARVHNLEEKAGKNTNQLNVAWDARQKLRNQVDTILQRVDAMERAATKSDEATP